MHSKDWSGQEFREQVNFESVEVSLLTTMSSSFYEACLQGIIVRIVVFIILECICVSGNTTTIDASLQADLVEEIGY